jgi:GNAT superfamily N-acetyltransferase
MKERSIHMNARQADPASSAGNLQRGTGVAGKMVVVPAADLTFELLGGAPATARGSDVAALHAEAYPGPPASREEDGVRFARQFGVWRRQPGFALAAARSGDYLIGYAAGMPLRPATSWWRDLTAPLPEEVTAEHPGRTFAITGLLVRASWRRQGIGRDLHDLLLGDRTEERATLTAPPAATAAQHAVIAWGWHKVARTRDPGLGAGSAVSDVFLMSLPVARGGGTAAHYY